MLEADTKVVIFTMIWNVIHASVAMVGFTQGKILYL